MILNVIRINMTAVNDVMMLRFITFGFASALVSRQCCQMCTSISAYHAMLTTQWNDPHELSAERADLMEIIKPASSNISTVAFEMRLESMF
jgi:hypothetical protein